MLLSGMSEIAGVFLAAANRACGKVLRIYMCGIVHAALKCHGALSGLQDRLINSILFK